MSSELLCSPHCYEPRVNLAIVQNWRDRQKQIWYLDTWVTSLAACFSTLSHALYQMVAQPYHHLTPISLRSTPNRQRLMGRLSQLLERQLSSSEPSGEEDSHE